MCLICSSRRSVALREKLDWLNVSRILFSPSVSVCCLSVTQIWKKIRYILLTFVGNALKYFGQHCDMHLF